MGTVIVGYRSTEPWAWEGTNLQHTDCCNFLCDIREWRHVLSTITVMFAVLLVGILQGVERPGSVYSIMPQCWHLMMSHYMAASFQLPSVSTANINTVQYTKPRKENEIPTIPDLVISKMLLPQSNIMAAVVHNLCSLFSDVSPGLPKHSNPATQHTVLFTMFTCCCPLTLLHKMSNCQHTATHLISQCLTATW